MRKKMTSKKIIALGLSAAMFGSSTGVWAESLENSTIEQESVAEELNEMEIETTEQPVQIETAPETEAVEYPEEASTYPQEMQVTVAENVLVDETVVENTVTQIGRAHV